MFERFFKRRLRIQELRDKRGGDLLERFAEELFHAGYAARTARRYICAVEHFLYWSGEEGIPVMSFTQKLVERFGCHLNECKCPGYNQTKQQDLLCGVRLFLKHMRDVGEITTANQPTAEDPVLLTAFCHWMRKNRGTSDITLCNYSRPLRDFLKCFGNNPDIFDAKGLTQLCDFRSINGAKQR